MDPETAPAIQAVSGVQRGIGAQIALTLLNVRQQVIQQHPNPGGLLWMGRGVEDKHGDAGGHLLHGQEGVLKQFGADAVSGERGHRVWATAHRVPTAPLCGTRIVLEMP